MKIVPCDGVRHDLVSRNIPVSIPEHVGTVSLKRSIVGNKYWVLWRWFWWQERVASLCIIAGKKRKMIDYLILQLTSVNPTKYDYRLQTTYWLRVSPKWKWVLLKSLVWCFLSLVFSVVSSFCKSNIMLPTVKWFWSLMNSILTLASLNELL